jgi:dipeptidyl aminopeptidase/acylaminoacyl peptidase
MHWKRGWFVFVSCLVLPICLWSASADHDRRFGVKDDIALVKFGAIEVSPRKDLVLVPTERASLEDGLMHDTVRVYRLNTLRKAVNASGPDQPVEPLWSFERVTKDPGGNTDRISRMKWLSEGNAFAFLFRVDPYHHRLFLADVAKKEVVALSAESDDVLGFDIRDATHYVFTVASHDAEEEVKRSLEAPYRVGTGKALEELVFPQDLTHFIQRADLWAAIGGSAKPVFDSGTGKPVALFSDGNESLSLSPDGTELVTLRAVQDISEDWVRRFPPPFPNALYALKARHQDLSAPFDAWSYVSEWVRIRLADGQTTYLTNAPAAVRAGWWEVYAQEARWSDDGSTIVLPGTFRAKPLGEGARPCVLAVRVKSDASECVRPLKKQLPNGYEEGWESIDDIEFVQGRNDELSMSHNNAKDTSGDTTTVYGRSDSGDWTVIQSQKGPVADDGFTVRVNQSFNEPPLLVASDATTKRSRTILDPNPQLKAITLGEPEAYSWQDKTGRAWQGILYKPVGFTPGNKYPLVIQTHGFTVPRFLPSGGFPSAFVAQELASAGIMVLQVRDCAGRGTPIEGPCNVEGYEGAVDQLSLEGMVDSTRVGIIGFSRTVFYVLEALTTSRIRFKAASITDGITLGYWDFLACVDIQLSCNDEDVQMIGAQPFGNGLAQWLKASPDFHLDRVTAPLRIVTRRESGVFWMWEPYALLEEMHKPVDLIVLNTQEHVLEDPTMRLVAQTGNVDWFRFWLQGYEDPDPAKQSQYARWSGLRDGTANK